MPWNPAVYNEFKNIRFKPFFDLLSLIQDDNLKNAIDLGCGTGEQTAILADTFPQTNFVGIDASKEMLAQSKALETANLTFKIAKTEEVIAVDQTWDLIFSNAALQWSDNHQKLFPAIIARLNPGGQLAIQMPYQPENVLNQILFQLVNEEPFKTKLNAWNRASTVLTLDDYAQILFDNNIVDMNISQRVYPIIADDVDTLYNFISGSALIPYVERLSADDQVEFIDAFKQGIAQAFPKFPAVYAFKRILLYGKKAM